MNQSTTEILELIRFCAAGEAEARRRFQGEYGEDIYNFPVKIYGLASEEAGDFYVYAFDKDRIFIRMKTFAGYNNIQFRTFLSYYVLKHLFLEWQRTKKEVETISLQTPVGDDSREGEMVLENLLPDPATAEAEEVKARTSEGNPAARTIWMALTPEERLDLKLLSLLECGLEPEDVRLLAKISGRSIADTLGLVAEVQEGLKRKDEQLSQLQDELDSTWGWILLRRKELQEIGEKIHLLMGRGESSGQEELFVRKNELERVLAKRHHQKERILQEIRGHKLTTPYKDIARLLNLTVGTVCSRIFRLRERLVREFGER